MQNNIQHRITGLLNAYKRNRRWKILTIILSVAVLCNTFYAMRQAAVAVTEQNAETSQIDQILGIEGQQTTGQESVAPGTGGSIETVPAPTPTPVATDPLPTTPVGTDPATTDPTITGGGEATTDPAVIPETGATDPSGAGITGSIGGLVVPEGQEVILPADAYGTTPAEYDEYGNPIYPEEAPIEEPAEIDERITLETYVGETLIQATFMSSAFENEVWLEAEQLSALEGEEETEEVLEKRRHYEEICRLVEEAAAYSDRYDAKDFAAFDIRFRDLVTQQEVEPYPGSQILVTIATDGEETPDEVAEVLHIDDYLQVEEMYASIDEENATAEFVTDSFSDYVLMGVPGVPAKIESAYPTIFRIVDENGSAVTRVMRGDPVSVIVGWDISDRSEVDVAGDYVEIELPDGLDFSAVGSGPFLLNETTTLANGKTYDAGTQIAHYAVDASGKYLTVTYDQPSIDLIEAKLLFPALTLKGQPWAVLPFGNITVDAEAGPYRPEIKIGGTAKALDRTITVMEDTADQITQVTLGQFLINGHENGKVSGTNYNPTYVEVGKEEKVQLKVSWSWKTAKGVTNGDYFELRLPDTLTYTTYGPRAIFDTQGNMVTDEVYYDDARGAYYWRNTYASVTSYGYNQSQGVMTLSGYIKNADQLPFNASGKHNLTLTMSVNDGIASKTGYVTVVNRASADELRPGEWMLRKAGGTSAINYDYESGSFLESNTYRLDHNQRWVKEWKSTAAHLFVISAHSKSPLVKDPFADTDDRVDFVPGSANYATDANYSQTVSAGGSNYLVAYCATADRPAPMNNGRDWSTYKMLDLSSFSGLNQAQKETLTRIMSNAYPYVTMNDVYTRLRLDEWRNEAWVSNATRTMYGGKYNEHFTAEQLSDYYEEKQTSLTTAAINYAIWQVTSPNAVKLLNGDYETDFIIEDMARRLMEAPLPQGSGTGYRIDGTPTLSVSDAGVATVTGKIIPATGATSLTGTFTTAGGKKAPVTINNDGTFRATLSGVTKADEFHLHFSGTAAGNVRVWYFSVDKSYWSDYGTIKEQDLIAAEVCNTPFSFGYDFPSAGETSRKIRVIKRWEDENGNVMTELPNQTVTVNLYCRVKGGERESVQVITLSKNTTPAFTAEINNLPIMDTNGNAYDYWIEEPDVPDGYTLVDIEPSAAHNGQTLVLTAVNRKEKPEPTKVKVEKKWQGVDRLKFAVRVQLFATIDGVEKKVYTDVNPRQDATRVNGVRTLSGNWFFESAAGREEVIVFLNELEGWTHLFDQLPKKDKNGNTIAYAVREISVGYAGQGANKWTVNEGRAGEFVVTHSPENGMADMDDVLPTVTITNALEDTEITVVKEWKDETAQARGYSATVRLYRMVGDTPQPVYGKFDNVNNQIQTSGDGVVMTASEYRVGSEPGYNPIQYTLTGAYGNKLTVKGLPKYEEDGITLARYIFTEDEYVYLDANGTRIKVSPVPGDGPFTVSYQQADMSEVSPQATISNTYDRTKVKVVKTWEGKIPDVTKDSLKAEVQLFRKNVDGTKSAVRWKDYKTVSEDTTNGLVMTGTYSARVDSPGRPEDGEPVTVILKKENNWTATFLNLPKYEDDGKTQIEYLIGEVKTFDGDKDVTGDFSVSYGPVQFDDELGRPYAKPDMNQEEPIAAITNTLKEGSLRVVKRWINADEWHEGTAWANGSDWSAVYPGGVKVKLSATRNGNPMQDSELEAWVDTLEKELNAENNWTVSWTGLPDMAGIRYFVKETGFVKGNEYFYEQVDENGNVIRLVGSDGSIIKDGEVPVIWNEEEGLYEVTLFNRRRPVDVVLIKTEEGKPSEKLKGAEFELYKSPEDGKSSNGMEKIGKTKYTTDENGEVHLVDNEGNAFLVIGQTYVLIETKAPDNYQSPHNMDPIVFKIVIDNGTPCVRIYNVAEQTSYLMQGDRRLTIEVENKPVTYELPEAGGVGTKGYMAGGMSLITATLLMYMTLKFMQKTRKRGASK